MLAGTPLILFKKATDQKFSSWSYTFWWSALALIIVSPLALINFSFPSELKSYGLISLSAVGWTLVNLFNFLAFKYADASVVLLIGRLSNVTIFLSGVILLLVTAGSMAVIFQRKKLAFDKGVLLSFLPVVFMTFAFYFDKQASVYFNPFAYILIQQAIQIIFILPWIKDRQEIMNLIKQKGKYLIPAMFCFVVAFSGFIFLLRSNELSVLPLTYETSIFISSMILGIIFLSERQKLSAKIFGAILTVIGVLLLGL